MSGTQPAAKSGMLAFMGDAWPFMVIPLLVGIPFLLIGLSEAYKSLQLERNWVSTRGTVVDNYWQAFAQGGAAYVPVVDFQTPEGQTVRFTDGIGSIPPDYEVGSEVRVLYDPDDVHSARVVSWKRLWLAPTLLTSVGLLPTLIAAGVALIVGRKVIVGRRPAPQSETVGHR
jgi:hypothetical protein